MFSFLIYLKNYFYNPWGQVGFKDPATSLMENIIDLHHFIFFFHFNYFRTRFMAINTNY